MKFLFILLTWLGLTGVALASDVHVNGYYRSNGTYVEPHYRSAPDGNRYNNFSAASNTNPYTGERGTVNPNNSYNSTPPSNYNSNINQYGSNPYGQYGN